MPFQNDYFDKNSLFGPYFAYFPLFPADMVIFLVKTVNTISFAPEKWSELRAKPKKCHFSLIFGRYLKFTQIWCLRGSAVKRDKKWKFWSFFDMIGVRTCCFDDNSPNMQQNAEKSAKFCLFKMINFRTLFCPFPTISNRYDHFC